MGNYPVAYCDGSYQFTQQQATQLLTLSSPASPIRVWFAGNGVDNYLVESAVLSGGDGSVSLMCNGHASFYVPPSGRWSDDFSVSSFTSGDASLVFAAKGNVPLVYPEGGTGALGIITAVDDYDDETADLVEIVVAENTGTISFGAYLTAGDSLVIGDITYGFVKIPTGAKNEILLGGAAAKTAASISAVLNNTFGGLISASVVSGSDVAVVVLDNAPVPWEAHGLFLVYPSTFMDQSVTVATPKAPAAIPLIKTDASALEEVVYGNIHGSVNIPMKTGVGTAFSGTSAGQNSGVGAAMVPTLQSGGFACYTSSIVPPTDAEKIAFLHYADAYFQGVCAILFAQASSDALALEIIKYIAANFLNLSDSLNYGITDFWADPRLTCINGSGDCEDLALLQACLMLNAGIDPSRVRVYFGTYSSNGLSWGHSWVEYRRASDEKWIAMDIMRGLAV